MAPILYLPRYRLVGMGGRGFDTVGPEVWNNLPTFNLANMYCIYKEIHPPTTIEQCCYCHYFNHSEKNLIVASVNYITIYRLIYYESNINSNDDSSIQKVKLEQVTSYSFFGNIVSMQAITLPNSQRDSILLSFPEAKLSIVEYNPLIDDLQTISLHYFEDADLKGGRCRVSNDEPEMRVDPLNRCAAIVNYACQLVVIPFFNDCLVIHDFDAKNAQQNGYTSYIIDLQKIDQKVASVIDFQFLHGYYEPTIAILFEPLPTWAGRIAVRKDTCYLIAISLNIDQKVNPIIWTVNSLPFDCLRIIPVQKPIGGVLLFATNSMLYLNQSFPIYGVSLNSIASSSSDFLLKPQDGIKITLDSAKSTFIGHDKLVISLKGGEIFILTLVTDGLRAVRSFHIDKAAASVITSCMCSCGDGYLFFGSRLGNSLLLKFTEKISQDLPDEKEEPALKKKKEDDLEELDELEVYGDVTKESNSVSQYSFEVCDSLLNIGPCGQMIMGETGFLSEEFHDPLEPDVELVTTSGYGKNGALSVLQRSIRPQVVTTFELLGCVDMWTVVGGKAEEEEDNVTHSHSLLIISKQESSMILKTGQEIMELDHSGFITQAETIFAANIGNNLFIVQVTSQGVRLLEGAKNLQHMSLDDGSPIILCSLADPYLLILLQSGKIFCIMLKSPTFGSVPRLTLMTPKLDREPKVKCLCAYMDKSGLFVDTLDQSKPAAFKEPNQLDVKPIIKEDEKSKVIADEDDLLYGTTSSNHPLLVKSETNKEMSPKIKSVKKINETYWLFAYRENGCLEIYSIPEFKLMYEINNFSNGPKLCTDTYSSISETKVKEEKGKEHADINELLITAFGHKNSRPYLMARSLDTLFIYNIFEHDNPTAERLKLRFRKINHGLILRPKSFDNDVDVKLQDMIQSNIRWLRRFDDISGYSGVFICGSSPHWMFVSPHGALRFVPMNIDGIVTCFTSFHNVNCPKGFLYFNRQNELRICVLPSHLVYDSFWPLRKIPLRCTPYYLAYNLETKLYASVLGTSEACTNVVKVVGDNEKEIEAYEKDDRFIYPSMDHFSIQLFSPISWEAIPSIRYDLNEFERATCFDSINLKCEGTVSGVKGYIVCGTNYAYTEDISAKGRIIILDIIEVVPEPGQPLTKNKFKVEYDKEQKGSVTAICGVQGFLVTAIGQKIYIWQLKDGDLKGVAFIDAQIYAVSLSSIKNLILVGDVAKSIFLLRYQEDMKVLSLVSRDIKLSEVYSTSFLIDNNDLGFLVTDRLKNILLYLYLPELKESFGGQRLLQRADFNIGGHVNSTFRIRCKLTDPSLPFKITGPIERRHTTYLATLDGGIGCLLPLPEKLFRRLLMLQNILNVYIPHNAGLNPKSFRLLYQEYRQLSNPHKNIVDGVLIAKFLDLSRDEQKEVAGRIGTSVDMLLNDLVEIERITSHF